MRALSLILKLSFRLTVLVTLLCVYFNVPPRENVFKDCYSPLLITFRLELDEANLLIIAFTLLCTDCHLSVAFVFSIFIFCISLYLYTALYFIFKLREKELCF